jgi:hypothetical protein
MFMIFRSHDALAARIWLVGISSEFDYERRTKWLVCLRIPEVRKIAAVAPRFARDEAGIGVIAVLKRPPTP